MQEPWEQGPEPLGDTENLMLLTSCLGRSLPNNRTACNGIENESIAISSHQPGPKQVPGPAL